MARKRVYTGCYRSKSKERVSRSRFKSNHITEYLKQVSEIGSQLVMDNYILCAALFCILVMSFVLPNCLKKIGISREIVSLKNIVNLMSKEVSRAEVACLTVADRLCYLQCIMRDGTTETSKRDYRDLSVCTSLLRTEADIIDAEKTIGFFKKILFPRKTSSQQELTIMSYVYTNSFDAAKSKNGTVM